MPENLDNTIRENVEGPAEASVDGQSVKQHRPQDQIKVDRYLVEGVAQVYKDR